MLLETFGAPAGHPRSCFFRRTPWADAGRVDAALGPSRKGADSSRGSGRLSCAEWTSLRLILRCVASPTAGPMNSSASRSIGPWQRAGYQARGDGDHSEEMVRTQRGHLH